MEGNKLFADCEIDENGDFFKKEGWFKVILRPTGKGEITKIIQPMYKEMAEYCLEQKNMCFDDTTSLKYDGKKWTWLTKIAFYNFILEQNKKHIKPGHLDNFVKIIKAKCLETAVGVIQPEALINVDNGIIDVRTGELMPHTYKYMFKYCAPVSYNKMAECPRWERFLLEVFENNVELIDLAQRLFGYIMIGGRPFLHKAFVLYGSGRNGKSTFLDVLRAVVGYESYSTVSMAKLDKEFSIVNIDGMLANIVEETPTDEINAEAFKNMVAGGEVQAAHKGMDEYKFRCKARFVFACNEMPIFKDKTIGLEDRLIFIPFNRYFKEAERDTSITETLLSELPGILNWAVKGAQIILAEKRIPTYEVTKKAKEQYRLETNPLYAWCVEEVNVTANPKGIVEISKAYEFYVRGMEENGNRPLSKDKFSRHFRKWVKEVCEEKGIYYDPNVRSTTSDSRALNVIDIRGYNALNSATSASTLFSSGDKKWTGYT